MKYMTFAKATNAPKPRSKNAVTVTLFYAAILVVMAVGQLLSFEKFIPLIESYLLPGGHGTAVLVAGALVIAEVFALPFLLRMTLSPLMRFVSMAAGWLVPIMWFKLVIWANVMPNAVTNIGLLGTHFTLPVGWWSVLFVAALGVLAVWSAWGLWPDHSHRKSLKK